MSIETRRVVTGHDSKGRAIVLFDGPAGNVISTRPKQQRSLIWMNDTLPARNDGGEDMGERDVGVGVKGGAIFGIVRTEPGARPRMHRTETIDYGVIVKGSLVLELDDGVEVTLNTGDVFVQRGTIHAWHNRGTEACEMVVTLIDAAAAEAGGTYFDDA
jgi:quercetin dioxygenase-like cupin family protein